MKYILLSLALLASPVYAECNIQQIDDALSSPLTAIKPKEIGATNVQSTEGALWHIYRETDGRLNTLVRMDFAETGKLETRLSVVNRSTYGIASIRISYLRPIEYFVKNGPNGIARRTIDYYYFCNGKPFIVQDGSMKVDILDYANKAKELKAIMLDDKDISEITKGLIR